MYIYYFNIHDIYIYVSIYDICWFEWLALWVPSQQQQALGFDGSARHWPDLRVLEMNLLRPEAKPRGVTGVDPTPVSGGRIKECKMYGGFCRISGKTVMQLCRLVIVTSYIYYNEGIQSDCQRMIGVCNHLGMRSRDREKVEFIWLHNTDIRGL